jgi:hypothetical protein
MRLLKILLPIAIINASGLNAIIKEKISFLTDVYSLKQEEVSKYSTTVFKKIASKLDGILKNYVMMNNDLKEAYLKINKDFDKFSLPEDKAFLNLLSQSLSESEKRSSKAIKEILNSIHSALINDVSRAILLDELKFPSFKKKIKPLGNDYASINANKSIGYDAIPDLFDDLFRLKKPEDVTDKKTILSANKIEILEKNQHIAKIILIFLVAVIVIEIFMLAFLKFSVRKRI